MTRLTGTDAFGLMEAYNAVYIPQELTEEQIQEDFESWVSSLMEEGNDLSDYTWDEMFDIYIDEAKEDENLTPLQKIRKRNKRDSKSLVSKPGGQTDERRAYHEGGRGEKKKKGEKSVFDTMRHVGGPYKEEVDLYDVILSHLLDEGYANTVDDALAIMANMSDEWKESIIEAVDPITSQGAKTSVSGNIKPGGNIITNAASRLMGTSAREIKAKKGGVSGTMVTSQRRPLGPYTPNRGSWVSDAEMKKRNM